MDSSFRLGKYRVISLLATGGMGEVFLARQEGPAGFSKTVVVKRILRHLANDQTFIDMFVNEARLAALLSHHNIVQIFELGQEEDTWFIAMEYVHGRSLRNILEKATELQRPIPAPLAARVCSQALQGLHHAHQLTDDDLVPLGIVHRDVSPENILVGFSGVVKVVDFGVAKAAAWMTHTYSGTVKGKYDYLAPEQLTKDVPADPRIDVYAMGVVLYEMLAGVPPFAGAMGAEKLEQITRGAPAPLSERNPDVSTALNAIVMRALAKNRDDRWTSAEDMANALEAYLSSLAAPLGNAQVAEFLRHLYGVEAGPSSMPRRNSAPEIQLGAAPVGTAVIEDRDRMQTMLMDDAQVSEPVTEYTRPSGVRGTQVIAAEPPFAPTATPRRSRGRSTWWVGILGVLVGGSVAYWAWPAPPAPPIQTTAGLPTVAADPAPPPVPVPGVPAAVVLAEPPTDAGVEAATGSDHSSAPAAVRPKAVKKKSRPGKVIVRVHPWAEVFYGGKSLGITPMPAVEVPAGTATFVLKNKELKVTRKVSVKVPPGGEVVLKVKM